MNLTLLLVIAAALALAFANGANDNSKGVATLIGAGMMPVKKALLLAAVATFAGSAGGIFLGQELLHRFGGHGLVGPGLVSSSAFPASVGFAAALTVLAATRLGMPVSTTHAMVGAITGVGLSAHALYPGRLLAVFAVPLIVSPFLALLISAAAYLIFRRIRLKLGIDKQTCLCIEEEVHPVQVQTDGTLLYAETGLKVESRDLSECVDRYEGRVVGMNAQRILDTSHLFSAAAISFARGLNDTPKIAAVIFAAGGLGGGNALLAVGVAIALGGLLAARRVGETMSERITGMNDGQAFSANLMTALCVLFASRLGVPVSTTHVCCGSLFGIGLVNGEARWKMIGRIFLAWVTTLPVAAVLAFLFWKMLNA